MSTFDYSDVVLDHYDRPRNVGEAAGENAFATVESSGCGDRLRLSLRIDDDGVIREARFRTFGCVAAIAASSMTTELLEGVDVRAARSITDARVAEALGGLPPRKVHCSVLAEKAIHAAIENHESRPDTARVPASGAST